jgi:SAM-dependent methyltransferase
MLAAAVVTSPGACQTNWPARQGRRRGHHATQLDIARREADAQGIRNVEFRLFDIRAADEGIGSGFDVVYARFLLTHLDNPFRAIAGFYRYLWPGGRAILEDVDFDGYFTYPESKAFQRYKELYCKVARRRGGDPNIGPRLPILLSEAPASRARGMVRGPRAI